MSKYLGVFACFMLISACTVTRGEWPHPDARQWSATQEFVISPSGQYIASLSILDVAYHAIREFYIYDVAEREIHHQPVHHPDAISYGRGLFSGTSFEWTPSENYLVIIARTVMSSHGCTEMFVFTGNGDTLVFSTGNTTSLCRLLDTSAGLRVHALCPNDDIYYNEFRLTPSTGEYIEINHIIDETTDICSLNELEGD